MDISNEISEKMYLDALERVLSSRFSIYEYKIGEYQECATCIEKEKDEWIVYDAERGVRLREERSELIAEACMMLLKKMTIDEQEITSMTEEMFKYVLIKKKMVFPIQIRHNRSNDKLGYARGKTDVEIASHGKRIPVFTHPDRKSCPIAVLDSDFNYTTLKKGKKNNSSPKDKAGIVTSAANTDAAHIGRDSLKVNPATFNKMTKVKIDVPVKDGKHISATKSSELTPKTSKSKVVKKRIDSVKE